MATTITLIPKSGDGTADQIIEAFAQRTGLSGYEQGTAHVFALEGKDHAIEIVHVLDAIDPDWPVHVDLQSPG
jgi:diacylglycerol kinase family enzyme